MFKPVFSNFLGITPDTTLSEEAQYCVVQAPFEHTSYFQTGAALGPQAILRASELLSSWDQTLNIDLKDHPFQTIALEALSKLNLQEGLDEIENQISRIFNKEQWPLVLGGESSLSIACAKAASKKHKDLVLIMIDAFPNLEERVAGSSNSPRSLTRLCLDQGFECVHLASRRSSRAEHDFIQNTGGTLKLIKLNDLRNPHKQDLIVRAFDSNKNYYLSLSMASLDPTLCPSVHFPEPEGLQWQELLDLLSSIFDNANIVGADLCGLIPNNADARSDVLAAQLAHRLLLLKIKQEQRHGGGVDNPGP